MKRLFSISVFCFLLTAVYAQQQQLTPAISSFHIKTAGNGVTLSWPAHDETNLYSYVVEYSSDGQTFSEMGIVKAGGMRMYEMLHANPFDGANYYRLKINLADGRTQYGETRQAVVTSLSSKINTWLGASGNELYISLGNDLQHRELEITVLSATGVALQQTTFSNTSLTEKIDLGNLLSGFYTLKITSYGEVKGLRAFIKN